VFLDESRIQVRAGAGGNGCVGFRREKHVAFGGPNGGDGGRGGHVQLIADPQIHTLYDIGRVRVFRGGRGQHGMGSNCSGKGGEDCMVKVPIGTMIKDEEGRLVCDLSAEGQIFTAARGGKGGLGNQHFATPRNQAPKKAYPGQAGEDRTLYLELRLVADVGLVGYPNAGKSSLLASSTHAHPRIADYPFTTLEPILGIVPVADTSFVMADIPGLIEGAASGKGLGTRFLRHVERTRTLLFVVDPWDPEGKEETDEDRATRVRQTVRVLRQELREYHPRLLEKPWQVAVNKCDRGIPFPATMVPSCHFISTASGIGIVEMAHELLASIKRMGQAPAPIDPEGVPEHLRPRGEDVVVDDEDAHLPEELDEDNIVIEDEDAVAEDGTSQDNEK
jgi:GTPase